MTGTVVWTVPGRSRRPIATPPGRVEVLVTGDAARACAFCSDRYLETPPERTRLVLDDPVDPDRRRALAGRVPGPPESPPPPGSPQHSGSPPPPGCALEVGLATLPGPWRVLRDLPAASLGATTAQFRRIPNLYPILTYEYWRDDHGRSAPVEAVSRAREYVASPQGRAHLSALARTRSPVGQQPGPAASDDRGLIDLSLGLFASAHDLVVAHRHFRDGALTDDQLCSAGDLNPDEHMAFLLLTIDALRDLRMIPQARYVSVFQNWLRPAGASFDHLHKQLVAIDEWGPLMTRVVDRLHRRPGLFDEVLDLAVAERLVIAENDGALAVAGVGHRYPTIELYATGSLGRPWEQDVAAVRALSDLLHACHAATGARVPTNEEWHYRPMSVDVRMPWRINLKWRISTLAGFEGGTKINVNTIDPYTLRAQVVARLLELRTAGRIEGMRIGDECGHRPGVLARAAG